MGELPNCNIFLDSILLINDDFLYKYIFLNTFSDFYQKKKKHFYLQTDCQ